MSELDRLRTLALDCRACPLWQRGTQTVFGEGSPQARVAPSPTPASRASAST